MHFLGDFAVDYDRYDVWHSGRSPEEIWRRYFETLAAAARSGLFDILAHPDLVKIWGERAAAPAGDLRRYYEPAIEAIAESGIAVEVSTAGLRKPVGEIYPFARVPCRCARGRRADRALKRRARPRAGRLRLRPGARAARLARRRASWRFSSAVGGALEPLGAMSVTHAASATTPTASSPGAR